MTPTSPAARLRWVFANRTLLKYLVIREIKLKSGGTYLGIGWTLMNPLFTIVVYFVIFRHIFRVAIPDFLGFFLLGFLMWTFFSRSITSAATCIIESDSMVKRALFPLEILPLTKVLYHLVNPSHRSGHRPAAVDRLVGREDLVAPLLDGGRDRGLHGVHAGHDVLDRQKERALGLLRPHLREAREQFWALHDISFAVEAGEMFGLIGANGAGKSTLLRIVAGIFRPTAGTIRVRGRVAPLLGLGVGFHQELTGRENIYLGAALFGFTTREIRALESGIIEFVELGQFIDVPVKNYSSGMQVRLGFSIALEVTPDIFLIDEVLAAGDEHFRRKCLRRLKRGRKTGCTYLIASHNLQFIQDRCDRAALIVNGRMAALGPAKEVVRSYEALVMGAEGEGDQEPSLSSGLP